MEKKIWNKEFVDSLEQLETIFKNKGESFRARAYKNAANKILEINENIYSVDQLKNVSNIGDSILKKLSYLVKDGHIKEIENEKNNIVHVFAKIYGVGPKKALELSENIKSLEELKENQDLLNKSQKIGLKHFDDLQKRIPRKEIDKYNKKLEKIISKFPNITAQIVGSYRRGAKDSGDIDIIVTSNDPNDFKKFIDSFVESKILIEILSKGKTKVLGISKLKDKPCRRIDFLYTSPKEYPFAVLYFTGSKTFNVKMRQVAVDSGYSLNEHKLTNAENVDFKTEKDIFDFLEIEYKNPEDRV